MPSAPDTISDRAGGLGDVRRRVPTFAMATPAEIAAEAPGAPRWFQLYWHPDREVTKSILDQAREAGCTAIVFTVDLPRLGRRERDLRTGFALDPDYRRLGVYGSESATSAR